MPCASYSLLWDLFLKHNSKHFWCKRCGEMCQEYQIWCPLYNIYLIHIIGPRCICFLIEAWSLSVSPFSPLTFTYLALVPSFQLRMFKQQQWHGNIIITGYPQTLLHTWKSMLGNSAKPQTALISKYQSLFSHLVFLKGLQGNYDMVMIKKDCEKNNADINCKSLSSKSNMLHPHTLHLSPRSTSWVRTKRFGRDLWGAESSMEETQHSQSRLQQKGLPYRCELHCSKVTWVISICEKICTLGWICELCCMWKKWKDLIMVCILCIR